jgi:hypothetical protein
MQHEQQQTVLHLAFVEYEWWFSAYETATAVLICVRVCVSIPLLVVSSYTHTWK